MKIAGTDIIELVVGYFGEYTDAPNSALVREISNGIKADNPTMPEEGVFRETVVRLRNDYGYGHPVEEQADRNEITEALARMSHRGNAIREKG